jgi:hypothetical protein
MNRQAMEIEGGRPRGAGQESSERTFVEPLSSILSPFVPHGARKWNARFARLWFLDAWKQKRSLMAHSGLPALYTFMAF